MAGYKRRFVLGSTWTGAKHERSQASRGISLSTMPPKGARKSAVTTPHKTLVLDNGAYTLKAGLVATGTDPKYDDCTVLANCIARSVRDKRTYVSSELASCKDFGELAFRRPVEKGFVVNWEAEKAIWEHEFTDSTASAGLKVGMVASHANQIEC